MDGEPQTMILMFMYPLYLFPLYIYIYIYLCIYICGIYIYPIIADLVIHMDPMFGR